MKTKSFLLFSSSVFAISLFLIIFHSQPPQSFQSIVTQTHQHIKDFQEQLHDEEQQNLVQEEKYLHLVGLEGHTELWHNTTVPVIVTHGRNDDHAPIVAFVRDAAKLPYTVLVYNLGLKPYSLAVVSNYCNSSKCAIVDFDLELFPSHVSDGSTTAYRPLIIQHALSRVGGVIYCESDQRWTGTAAELGALWARVAGEGGGVGAGADGGGGGGGLGALGVAAWARRAAVTSLTHPRMFRYLRARADDFLFVQMLDASRVVAAARASSAPLLRRWVQCALTLNCLVPIGAQSAAAACRFDKKPQYRYSGCHGQDASALSIILAARAAFDEGVYEPRGEPWRRVPPAAARSAFATMRRNATDAPAALAAPAAAPAAEGAPPPALPHAAPH